PPIIFLFPLHPFSKKYCLTKEVDIFLNRKICNMMLKSFTQLTIRSLARGAIITFSLLLFLVPRTYSMQDSLLVNITQKKITIKKVFEALEQQTGFIVFYNNNVLNDQKKINVDFRDARVQQVMDYVTKDEDLAYVVKNHFILLTKKKDNQAQ